MDNVEFPQEAIFIEDFAGNIIDVNEAACELLKYTREELLSMNAMALVPPEEQALARQLLGQNLAGKGHWIMASNVRRDGVKIEVELLASDFCQGGRQCIVIVMRDREMRQLAEKHMYAQNQFFQAMTQVSLGLLSQLDTREILQGVLQHASELFGTRDICIAMPSEDGTHLVPKLGMGFYAGNLVEFAPDDGLIGHVWRTREPQLVEDYKHWQGRLQHPVSDLVELSVAVPLISQDEVIGVIGMDFFDKKHMLYAEDIKIFTQFAQVVSLALINAGLYESLADSKQSLQAKNEELQRAYEELTTIHEKLIDSENELRQQYKSLIAKEAEVRQLSMCDMVTGVYNRTYFETMLKQIEVDEEQDVGLIICDLDGLKIINDTLGHSIGDCALLTVAKLLQEQFPDELVARIGGDEFAVLLHKAGQRIKGDCAGLKARFAAYNRSNGKLPLSISVGAAVRTPEISDMKVLFREADNNMYREKLHRSQSSRSSIVHALLTALEARDFQPVGHGARMEKLMDMFAEEMGIDDYKRRDLQLLARFHDIGKVGVPDHILFKAGPLDAEELAIMRQHAEVGRRIAISAAELMPIADWILKHHEHWNGGGYPQGLKGENIPLACRMLGIADAYDAMTSERPYRQAMQHNAAAAELRRCAGTQFDPALVDVFLTALARQEYAALRRI